MDFDNRHILDYKYSTNSDGELMIYDYCGNRENLCIPATIGGSPVTRIGPYAFSDKTTIKTVVIPDGVREININAFENCTLLTSVTLPDSITTIEACAFAGCENLLSVVIPAGVQELADQVFENCSSLSSVILPDGLKSIGCNVFENCTSLTRILLPEGFKRIERNAFENCTSLIQIDLPDSIEAIDSKAFSGCSALKSCNIPNNMEYMGYRVFSGCNDLVLSLVPGCFREGFAEYCQIPFILREDTTSGSCERSSSGILRDTLYEIVTHYEECRSLAGTLADIPVTITMERPFPWNKEQGRWVLHPGLAKTIWSFTFPEHYVRIHLKEALIKAFFHPDVDFYFPETAATTLVMEDSSASSMFSQLRLKGNTDILRIKPKSKYGYTTWIAVADSQIAIVEEFWYD